LRSELFACGAGSPPRIPMFRMLSPTRRATTPWAAAAAAHPRHHLSVGQRSWGRRLNAETAGQMVVHRCVEAGFGGGRCSDTVWWARFEVRATSRDTWTWRAEPVGSPSRRYLQRTCASERGASACLSLILRGGVSAPSASTRVVRRRGDREVTCTLRPSFHSTHSGRRPVQFRHARTPPPLPLRAVSTYRRTGSVEHRSRPFGWPTSKEKASGELVLTF
jgi:hypothetical protein